MGRAPPVSGEGAGWRCWAAAAATDHRHSDDREGYRVHSMTHLCYLPDREDEVHVTYSPKALDVKPETPWAGADSSICPQNEYVVSVGAREPGDRSPGELVRLRKQRVGLNRGFPQVWGLYACGLVEGAKNWSWGGADEASNEIRASPAWRCWRCRRGLGALRIFRRRRVALEGRVGCVGVRRCCHGPLSCSSVGARATGRSVPLWQ